MLASRGSGTRSWSFRARIPARPEASTTAAARSVASLPPASRYVTVTPSASTAASSTRCSSRTSAPHAGGVAEEQLVEIAPRHLPGLRRRHLGRRGEVGEALDGSVAGVERRAPLLGIAAGPDQVAGADLVQRVVHRGQQGFADVKAREAVALEHDDAPAGPGQAAGGGGPAGPASDDGDVEVVGCAHRLRRDTRAASPASTRPPDRSSSNSDSPRPNARPTSILS